MNDMDNKPLTLEELRQKGDKPVFVVEYEPGVKDRTGWQRFRRYFIRRLRVNEEIFETFGGGCLFASDYGKSWEAYTAPPRNIAELRRRNAHELESFCG